MTPAEAAKLVTIALANYPTPASFLGEDAVAGMATGWAMVLEDIAYVDGQAALKRYMATEPDKLPGPGHIRRIADEAIHGRPRTGASAWEDVRRAIGTVGRYRDPSFADPVTARVVAGLGWRELCDSENAIADRARFIAAYEQEAARAVEDRSVASLPGVARPALHPVEHAHALRAGERARLSPAVDGETPADRRTLREQNAPAAVGELLRALPGGRR